MTKKPTDWQQREMSMHQYRLALRDLSLSRAAAARWLGISPRTSSRYWHGKTTIHPCHAMLLRNAQHYGYRLVIPPWQPGD